MEHRVELPTPAALRIGLWSASLVACVGAAYLLTGIAWLLSGGLASADPLQPAEPFLAILELLIVLSAPLLVTLMAAIHVYAPPERKAQTLAALAFTIIFAVLTTGVHFFRLTVLRQLGSAGSAEEAWGRLYPWPSTTLALDFLAWDLFLGLAFLFAASVFTGDRLHAAVRVSMMLSGTLCGVGVLGPGLGDLRLQLIAVVGYAGGVPVIGCLLAMLFRRTLVPGSR